MKRCLIIDCLATHTREKAAELKRRTEGANLPPYEPYLAEKVNYLAEHQNKMDPAFYCAPKGFPHVGPPTEIIQNQKTLVFLYDTVNSSEQNAFRVVSTDGRPHDPTLNPPITPMQSAIGKATR